MNAFFALFTDSTGFLPQAYWRLQEFRPPLLHDSLIDQVERNHPALRSAEGAARLPHPPAQHGGGAGVARRAAGRQPGDGEDRRFPAPRPFFHNSAPAHLRRHRENDRAATGGKEGAIVGFFSLEMSSDQLAARILAEQANISGDSIRKGDISEDDFRRFAEASQRLAQVPLFIDDTGSMTIGAVRTRARRLKRQHGLGLLVVDYLQLLNGSLCVCRASRACVKGVGRGGREIDWPDDSRWGHSVGLPVLALSQGSSASRRNIRGRRYDPSAEISEDTETVRQLADLEARPERLDRGIAAEHVAMDRLLERVSSRLPHDSRAAR
jgi:hypothetical protein